LWEIVLLDGLADGRWALVSKTHHCLVDGVGSVGLVDLLLGAESAPREPSAPDATASGVVEDWLGWLPHPPEPVGQIAGAGLAAARVGAHALMHPREALERSRAVIDLLVRDELIAAPRSSLNVAIGATRLIATVHVELQEVQKVRAALGGKFNDVILCAATGGLRELLLKRGEDPPRQGLRAMVPVNIRREGGDGELGNQVSSLFIELPVAEPDPLRRYELVRATAQERKAGGQALAAGAVTELTKLAPPVLRASLASRA
jgi:WS/DGAT/MGAT family acyltransferase